MKPFLINMHFALSLLVGMVLLSVSCTKNFENMNKDPNRPGSVNAGAILSQVGYWSITESLYTGAWSFTHEIMQVHAPGVSTGGGGLHRYEIPPGRTPWQGYYERTRDLKDIYDLGESQQDPNYKAIALVYKSWLSQILTDTYGDIPYSQSLQAKDGLFKPVFDTQKTVYEGILADLETANQLFDASRALPYGGDMLFNANNLNGGTNTGILKWKKFCNSLRLRVLLRILKRDGEIDVTTKINQILADPVQNPLMQSNSDGAIYVFTGSNPYYNPFHNARQLDWSETYYFTKFFLKKLNEVEDPRRSVWCTTVTVGGVEVYQGIESGYPPSHAVYLAGENSTYPEALKTSPIMGVMMSYAELEFIKAELSLKGFNTGLSPRQHYEAGIRASIEQWQLTVDDDFFTQAGIVYQEHADAAVQMEQIMLQKYYALFFTDMQSWFEKKRTGYPLLPRGDGIPIENQFPNRVPYPTYLQTLNPENLAAAAARMGGDTPNQTLWWQ